MSFPLPRKLSSPARRFPVFGNHSGSIMSSPYLAVDLEAAKSSASAPNRAAKASEIAAQEIDRISDPSATEEERQVRKRRLIKGPKEFRDIRKFRSIDDRQSDRERPHFVAGRGCRTDSVAQALPQAPADAARWQACWVPWNSSRVGG